MTNPTDKPDDLGAREFRVEAQRLSRKRLGLSPRQAKKHAKLTLRAERASKNQPNLVQ